MQLQFHADFKASSAFPIKLKSAGGVLRLSAPRLSISAASTDREKVAGALVEWLAGKLNTTR
jgi:hypothetical protein